MNAKNPLPGAIGAGLVIGAASGAVTYYGFKFAINSFGQQNFLRGISVVIGATALITSVRYLILKDLVDNIKNNPM
jgi:hypothetical protein